MQPKRSKIACPHRLNSGACLIFFFFFSVGRSRELRARTALWLKHGIWPPIIQTPTNLEVGPLNAWFCKLLPSHPPPDSRIRPTLGNAFGGYEPTEGFAAIGRFFLVFSHPPGNLTADAKSPFLVFARKPIVIVAWGSRSTTMYDLEFAARRVMRFVKRGLLAIVFQPMSFIPLRGGIARRCVLICPALGVLPTRFFSTVWLPLVIRGFVVEIPHESRCYLDCCVVSVSLWHHHEDITSARGCFNTPSTHITILRSPTMSSRPFLHFSFALSLSSLGMSSCEWSSISRHCRTSSIAEFGPFQLSMTKIRQYHLGFLAIHIPSSFQVIRGFRCRVLPPCLSLTYIHGF